MAIARKKHEPPKKWEILGAIFGYFATAKDIPEVMKTLQISRLIPECLKYWLKTINSSSDFWYLITFTLSLLIFLSHILWKEYAIDENENSDSYRIILENELKRISRNSLGLVNIRNTILSFFDISVYGTIQRQHDWKPKPNFYKYIDRITFTDGHGIEFQYSYFFSKISVREHTVEDINYTDPIERKPTWKEIGILLFSSNFFPFWIIPHLIIRIFIP